MDSVFSFQDLRLVDLSKELHPKDESRRLEIRRYKSYPMGDYHSEIDIMSHLGTHVESPYHYSEDWKDILQVPLDKYIGRAVLLDLDISPGAPVTAEVLDRSDKGRIMTGDIVLLNSPFVLEPFTSDSNTDIDKRPYVCKETAEWLSSKQVKAVGFGDTVSIEKSIGDVSDFHRILMSRDVLFLEVLKNLDKLEKDIFLLVYFPLPISGLDSCPVRVVAIEGMYGSENTRT